VKTFLRREVDEGRATCKSVREQVNQEVVGSQSVQWKIRLAYEAGRQNSRLFSNSVFFLARDGRNSFLPWLPPSLLAMLSLTMSSWERKSDCLHLSSGEESSPNWCVFQHFPSKPCHRSHSTFRPMSFSISLGIFFPLLNVCFIKCIHAAVPVSCHIRFSFLKVFGHNSILVLESFTRL
jgi:hypothetical protein